MHIHPALLCCMGSTSARSAQMVLTAAERVVERSVERSKALSSPLLTLSFPRDTGIGSRAAASSLSTAVAILPAVCRYEAVQSPLFNV